MAHQKFQPKTRVRFVEGAPNIDVNGNHVPKDRVYQVSDLPWTVVGYADIFCPDDAVPLMYQVEECLLTDKDVPQEEPTKLTLTKEQANALESFIEHCKGFQKLPQYEGDGPDAILLDIYPHLKQGHPYFPIKMIRTDQLPEAFAGNYAISELEFGDWVYNENDDRYNKITSQYDVVLNAPYRKITCNLQKAILNSGRGGAYLEPGDMVSHFGSTFTLVTEKNMSNVWAIYEGVENTHIHFIPCTATEGNMYKS